VTVRRRARTSDARGRIALSNESGGTYIGYQGISTRFVPNIPEYSGPYECTPDLGMGNSIKCAGTEREARQRIRIIPS
jgi:hypothetical protein